MSNQSDPLEKISRHLDESTHPGDQGVALATLAMIFSQNAVPPQLRLDQIATKVCNLITSSDEGVQHNALAALNAGVEVSDTFAAQVLKVKAVDKIARILSATPPPALKIIVNALGAVGSIAESSQEGYNAVVKADGIMKSLVSFSGMLFEEQGSVGVSMQEAVVDALCKVISYGDQAKEIAFSLGVVAKLANLLSLDFDPQSRRPGITVRALLGLGMILPGNEAAGVEFVQVPGAVATLLALMRQQMDGDCQHIAAGLFAEIGKMESAKDGLLQAMREAPKRR